ncbi:hypothetical protein HMPREF0731_1291 [Pseudoroseomonas cervicalis ATCC 49957]|uniref:ABC-type transport auxiliary lipoprotein component domain-containing protein n=2 Tax=Teichococcus cervicalis TaxID=204525 RepID=D5RJN1_9PROT|nr:hypothetical protein HMPREF0731_1291 [Pseudoroseomonas cervicalis ATCC 49957]
MSMGDRMPNPTRRHLGLLALLPLAACASPEPRYYRLTARPGPAQGGAAPLIELRRIGLARYLDRSEITRGGGGARVALVSGARWAEPLGEMVTRITAENLRQRLPGSGILAEGSALTAVPEAQAEAEIARLEEDEEGRVVIEAQLAARRLGGNARPVLRSLRETVPLAGTDTEALAAAMSQALALLADALAEMLRRA